jgi:hypothetical protein
MKELSRNSASSGIGAISPTVTAKAHTDDLLKIAIDAHGRLQRWKVLRTISLDLSIGKPSTGRDHAVSSLFTKAQANREFWSSRRRGVRFVNGRLT